MKDETPTTSLTLTEQIKKLVPKDIHDTIKNDLVISEDIDTEVDDAAKNVGWYAILSEKAESNYQKFEFGFKSWQAKEEASHYLACKRAGEKKPTGDEMKAYVRSQPKYDSWQTKLIQLDENRRIMKVLAKAFEIKANMIQTKASNRRNEVRRRS